MDQPGLDPVEHAHALRGLARINRWSRSDAILWPPLRDLARSGGQPLQVLDIATGAGDVPLRLARRAAVHGLKTEFTAYDISPTAIEHARRAAERAGVAVHFEPCDVLRHGIPKQFDVVACSLFLHHLDEGDAVTLLRRMRDAARRLVLVNDLARSRAGYLLAAIGTRLLSRSPVVHVDGPLSVRGAFTPAEVLRLAESAGLVGATVERKWPCRFLLSWSRP